MLNREEYERLRQELKNELSALQRKFPHYHHEIEKGWLTLDVYRVLMTFEVTDPCLQHAIKKLLVAGGRGAKDDAKDVAEAIATLTRWQQIRREDELSGWQEGYAAAPSAPTPAPLVLPGMPGLDVPRGTEQPPTCLVHRYLPGNFDADTEGEACLAPVEGCRCPACDAARHPKD